VSLSDRQRVWQTLRISAVVTLGLAFALTQERAHTGDPLHTPIFFHLLLYQDYYATLPFLIILVAALVRPLREAGLGLARFCGSNPWPVAGAAAAVLAAGARFVYHAHPLSMDEYAPLFQSEIFAQGRLTGQFPADLIPWLIPRTFLGPFFNASPAGAVISSYWPGFALLLTPFSALGIPWLLNPLIGGATVLVMHKLAHELLLGAEQAGAVVLLTLASPAVTINAISFYSMPAHLLASATFSLLLLRPSTGRAFAAGLVGSVALVLHNPVPHLLWALPWLLWIAWRPGRLANLAALAAGYLPLCLVAGLGWSWFQRGLGAEIPISEIATPAAAVHFAWRVSHNIFALPSHVLLVDRLYALGKLWIWASPALLVVAASGLWRMRAQPQWRLLGCSALLTFAGYLFVPYDQGHGWGFRYFHSAWLVLPLFATAAVAPPPGTAAPALPQLRGYLAACAVLSLVIMTGMRAFQVERFIDRHLAQLPLAASGETRVTIVEPLGGYYSVDLVQNDPFLRESRLTLVTRGAQRDAAMMARQFPGLSLLHIDSRGSVWGIPAARR
jgi:hypothetical protein